MTTEPQAASLSPELEDFAARLHAAKRDRTGIDLNTVTLPPTRELGYAVQAEALRLAGDPIVGFKIGSSSRVSQEKFGTNEPWYGGVPAPVLVPGGSTVKRAPHATNVEGEFALRLGKDLPARDTEYTADEVRAAVDAVAGAIEVVGRHFEGGPSGEGMLGLVIADHGVCVSLVLGDAKPFGPETDLRDHAVTMRINGEVVGEGVGSMALGDPVNSLTWLVNSLSKAGRGMRAGEWVTTGTCSGIVAVAPGDVAVADFGDLGNVEVTFAAE